jgi:hypothetical protein
MRFAPHWERVSLDEAGEPDPDGPFVAFGWSFSHAAEARQMATERAQRLRYFFEDPYEREGHEPLDDDYPTDGSVLREVVLEEGATGGVRWAITRNSYGASTPRSAVGKNAAAPDSRQSHGGSAPTVLTTAAFRRPGRPLARGRETPGSPPTRPTARDSMSRTASRPSEA